MSALCLLAEQRSRVAEDGEAGCRASSHYNEFLLGLGRQGSQRLLPPVLENKGDGGAKVFQAFVARRALPIRSRNLSAVSNMPRAVLLHYRSKFVAHIHILTLGSFGDDDKPTKRRDRL